LVLERAIQDKDMQEMLVTIFNDKDGKNTGNLQKAINQLEGIEKLRHQPIIRTNEVGEKIVAMFETTKLIPTLFFADPWGYKGLSLRLINSVLKDWGCDCIFFFNYNRINMGLGNNFVKEHMDALFGEERANILRARLESISSPEERELTIVEELSQALRDMGGKYVLPFSFRNESGNRTSHHLIFVTKHFKGYEVMKGVMDKYSSSKSQNVASFEYNPATERQPMLFAFTQPLDSLKEELLRVFAGQTQTMRQIYESHSVNTQFLDKHYKQVLLQLEEEERITVEKHRKKSFADSVRVTFPK